MKRKYIEIILEECYEYKKPKIFYEQYITPTDIASEMLHLAYMYNDINDKYILDLGCGTCRLSIGASILGAKRILAIDIDKDALIVAKENLKRYNIGNVYLLLSDVRKFHMKRVFDTTIQNPPFGVHNKGIDIIFLDKALTFSKVVYTIHKHETRDFIIRFVEKRGGIITNIIKRKFKLKRTYKFHKKDYKYIYVDIYRIIKDKK